MNNRDRVSHDCEKCQHNRVCQSQDACNLMDYCGNYAEKPRFKPGDAVWIISRDGDGQPDNGVECHSFLSEVGGVVIVSGDIFRRGALTRLLNKMVRQTRGYICATVMAIPAADCYATRNEAWAAYSKEVDGE